MSVSLTYATTEKIADEIARRIQSEARQLQHDWWAEDLSFFDDPEGEGRLYGEMKLFLIGYAPSQGYHEVDPEEDSLMAWRDASFIGEQLAKWSAVHGIEWELSCEGEVIGTVKNGVLDEAAKEFFDSLLDVVEGSHEALIDRARQISKLYADRWDEASL